MKIKVYIGRQTLELLDDAGEVVRAYSISTAANGAGEETGSYKTPRGKHIVRAKIGEGQPADAVFVRRRPTGEIYTPELAEQCPGRDWILTRILWLSGREVGFNRLGDVDTMRRYVYIHGTPDQVELGKPGSKGCVRMRNADIMDLFERVQPGIEVEILEHG